MLKTPPLISIAIITYNQKDFLRECIESCLSQDYENIEIVVADDCSTDGTQDMLRTYKEKYPDKFVLCLSEINKGITPNSNVAHFACSGKYIAWMGGDDLMLPTKLSKQVAYMEEHPECTICYHDLDVFQSETGKTLYLFSKKSRPRQGDVKAAIKYGTFNGACSTVVRKSKTPNTGFNKHIPVASDWLYWVESLANGGTIDYIDEVLGKYRRHSKNVTNSSKSISQGQIDHLNSCNYILSQYPHFFNEVMYRYSIIIRSLRHNLPYQSSLKFSLRNNCSFKSLFPLIVNFISFNKIKF